MLSTMILENLITSRTRKTIPEIDAISLLKSVLSLRHIS